jgi:NTE family protein
MLVDPVVEDMRILGNINMFFAEHNGGAQERRETKGRRALDASARKYREARGKQPYRSIPYIFIAPERRGEIGRVASAVFRDRYGGIKGLRSPDFPLLNRLLGGESPTHGELLSYLFFDHEFIEELIRMGQRDARRWLRADPTNPWQIEPLDAFMKPKARSAAKVRKVAARA